ncbi:MAG: hypothetical protein VKO21_03220 [Candidatus Sericytochromatia bacterium]|nr:hypothetical protein [Candidatus Sericytochromatia bacterium]
MLRDLQRQLGELLGRPADPLGAITPEQLKVVLRNIESRYHDLREENARLRRGVEEARALNERLEIERDAARREVERGPESMLSRMAELQRDLVAARDGQEQLAVELQHARELLVEAEAERARAEKARTAEEERSLALGAERDRLRAAIDGAEQAVEAGLMERRQALEDLRVARDEALRWGERVQDVTAKLATMEAELGLEREGKEAALRLLAADPEKVALSARVTELEAQLAEAREPQAPDPEKVALSARVTELEAQLAEAREPQAPDPEKVALSARVTELEAQLAEAREPQASDPEKVALSARVTELEDQLAEAVDRLVEKTEMTAPEARIVELEDQLSWALQRLEAVQLGPPVPKVDAVEGGKVGIDELSGRLAQAIDERDALGREVAALRAEQERLRAALDRLGEHQGTIQARVSDLSLRTRRDAWPGPESSGVGELRKQMEDLGHKLDRMVMQRTVEPGRPKSARPDPGAAPSRKLDWLLGP